MGDNQTQSDQSSVIAIRITIETSAAPTIVLEKKEVTVEQAKVLLDGIGEVIRAAGKLEGPRS